jgi:hypothetical protein
MPVKALAADIAAEMGIILGRITIVDGQPLGCLDVYLLNMSKNGHLVSALVYQNEIDELEQGRECDRLKIKIRSALQRLELLMEV